jgi:Mrr N-terminal domain
LSPSIPNSDSVDSAFRRVLKRLGTTRKRINMLAAKEMKADHYDLAEKWMEMGRSVSDFADRMEAFVAEWKRLVKATKIAARSQNHNGPTKLIAATGAKRTPTWKFCEPALRMVVARGGTATLLEIAEGLERDAALTLTDADKVMSSSGGTPRWHKTLRQSYRQCQREGWVEKHRDGVWRITPKGESMVAAKENRGEAQ